MILKCFICIAAISLAMYSCTPVGVVTARSRNRLNALRVGMTREQVMNTMGTESYYVNGIGSITNPYRSETFRASDGRVIQVLFYYTDYRGIDLLRDDDFTPVVLENGHVVGWGRTFFDDVRKTELRLR